MRTHTTRMSTRINRMRTRINRMRTRIAFYFSISIFYFLENFDVGLIKMKWPRHVAFFFDFANVVWGFCQVPGGGSPPPPDPPLRFHFRKFSYEVPDGGGFVKCHVRGLYLIQFKPIRRSHLSIVAMSYVVK